jgi:hypothetical protein
MGLSGFLNAWSSVLSEREEDIPHFPGFGKGVIGDAIEAIPAERHVLAAIMFGNISILVLVIMRWRENFWFPKVQDRVLVIPGGFVEELREIVMQEMEDKIETSDGIPSTARQDKPFVSESDILLAWVSNILIWAHDIAPRTAVQVGNVFDIRDVLGIVLGVYIGNATIAASALFQAREFGIQGGITQSTGLRSVALKIRHALET